MTDSVTNASGKELLDATQEAVIDVAGNVGKVLQDATAGMEAAVRHDELFYQSPEFWVGVSCVLAIAFLVMPVRRMMLQFFEKRRQGIIKRIDDAAALKTEARELLASYQKKLEDIESETGQIVQKARREASRFKKNSLDNFERAALSREKYADERLTDVRNRVTAEISSHTAEKTVSVLRQVLADKLSDKSRTELIDKSIDLLANLSERKS